MSEQETVAIIAAILTVGDRIARAIDEGNGDEWSYSPDLADHIAEARSILDMSAPPMSVPKSVEP